MSLLSELRKYLRREVRCELVAFGIGIRVIIFRWPNTKCSVGFDAIDWPYRYWYPTTGVGTARMTLVFEVDIGIAIGIYIIAIPGLRLALIVCILLDTRLYLLE